MTRRVAIVTGASRGIGQAAAVQLAHDFEVVVVARMAGTLADAADEVARAGAEPLALARDLRDAAACAEVVETTRTRFGRIDALANVAGAVPQSDLFDLRDEDWTEGLSLKFQAARGVADGVQVNAVLPGPVLTDRRRMMLQRYADAHGLALKAAMDRFAAESGIARYGEPADIAHVMAFLVAPETRWLTGTALMVDGGETKSV